MQSTYLTSVIKQFGYYKILGEKAMAQVPDDKLLWQHNPETNSITTIVRHIAGNMLSRFTDFLSSDGEKPWRDRDAEFQEIAMDRVLLMELWNKGWACLFESLSGLEDNDLETIVYIRNEGHTVTEAINRQLAHYPYHIGQIVHIAKMIAGENWDTLSIGRDKSGDYNKKKFSRERERRHFTDDV